MSYIKEGKDVKQQYYGNYCNYCRKNTLEIVPYHAFSLKLYNKIINGGKNK